MLYHHKERLLISADALWENDLADRRRIGRDLMKKIIVYTLLMKPSVPADALFAMLMATPWFRETVDLYFIGTYHRALEEIVRQFLIRKVIRGTRDGLTTSVAP